MKTSAPFLRREPLLLAAAGLLILAAAPAQYLGRQHDDILFVVASHALSYGHYVLFTSPGLPPLVHVWPGLPLLLLPVTWAAGEQLAAYQLWAAALLAACPWALWVWLKRRADPWTSLLVPLSFAASTPVLTQAGCVMPEVPYTLLAVALLWLLEAPRFEALKAGWLLAALLLIRPAGVSLLPAALARPLAGRRWAEAARVAAPAAFGCAAWLAWCRARAGFVQEASEWATSYEGRGLAGLAALPLSNARFFSSALGDCFLPQRFMGGAASTALGAALAALAAGGAWRLARRRPADPVPLMLAAAAGMHLLWGWQYERYLIPLLPLILLAAAEALGRRAPAFLAAGLACQLAFQAPRFLGSSPHGAPELAATYAWLRENSAASDVLASPLYVRDGYYAGRPSLPLADAPDSAALAGLMRRWKIRFVLWQELDLGLSSDSTAKPRRQLNHAAELLGDSTRFRRVFTDDGGRAALYEVLGG